MVTLGKFQDCNKNQNCNQEIKTAIEFRTAIRKHKHTAITILERVGIDYPIDFEEHIYCDKCWQCLDGDPEYDRDAEEIKIDENNLPF